MKKEIQPKYYEAKVTCATCGHTFKIGSTIPEIKVDTCYNCHSFYTGALNQVQATGRVERFNRQVQASNVKQAEVQKVNEARKIVAAKKAKEEAEKAAASKTEQIVVKPAVKKTATTKSASAKAPASKPAAKKATTTKTTTSKK